MADGPKPEPSIPADHDALWPRNAENRYRIYARRGRKLTVLATAATPAGVGNALVSLDDDARKVDRRLVDEGAIGVLDVLPDYSTGQRVGKRGGRWIVMPWHRPDGMPPPLAVKSKREGE